ncbi:MAG: hypothetical protein CME34_22865 [Gordonia sp.]|uniref:TY-Chap domain-containing protein n=1 Tax=Gordonia sp. (in: high G+C Gram-positive bacteria) TaxID=84139 RepID=UPI000C69864C|nr:hypothetical protein [Gordonia sp. (in: high G+C Gram-positive bacteria)]MAU84651.1 hypothetical protein [Gordonia sp. (in: high G+C Gram-positive bacteria)]
MTTEAYDDHDHDDEFDDEFEGYDEQVAESWREFTHDLAVRLGDLRFGSFDFIELAHPVGTREQLLITFRANRASRVRATVPRSALVGPRQPDWVQTQRTFEALDWRYLPRKEEYIREFGRKQLFRASVQTITLLRGQWGVTHPSFLSLTDPISTVHPFSLTG